MVVLFGGFSFFILADSLQNKKKEDRYKGIRQVGLLTTIPILLTVSPLIGFFIGRFLDGKLHTDPIFTIIFLVLGFIAGARQVARVLKIANKEYDKED
jgi:F0F1-type ATP synthase assembly protein I